MKAENNNTLILFLTAVIILCVCRSNATESVNSAWKSNPKVVVHIIPHSHQDVGYQQTAEEYYEAKVRSVYNTIVEALSKDNNRRFIAVEIYFLHRWWNDNRTIEDQREMFKKFVAEGRIEIVNGGWVMHDSAVTTFQGDIDQMTLGHRFVLDTLQVKPRIGWHIDPFGESTVSPTLDAMMGFNAFFGARISSKDKEEMEKDKKLEYVWRGVQSYEKKWDIFTHIMDEYEYSSDLKFDKWETPPVGELTALAYALDLAYRIDRKISWGATNQILYAWGGDFEFFDANKMYENMDKLLDFIRRHPDMFNFELKYSTLSEYLEAVHDLNSTWTGKTGNEDFFPYVTGPSYWTGFYSSRPLLKEMIREYESYGFALKKFFSLTGQRKESDIQAIENFKRACGDILHHDAITGTSNYWVQDDYQAILKTAKSFTDPVFESSFSILAGKSGNLPPLHVSNEGILKMNVNDTIPVLVATSLGWISDSVIRFAVENGNYAVYDSDLKLIDSEVIPSESRFEIAFHAVLPPLGFRMYYIHLTSTQKSKSEAEELFIKNSRYGVYFNATSGLIDHVDVSVGGGDTKRIGFTQDFYQYESDNGSSAYTFKPKGDAVKVTSKPETILHQGHIVQEALQVFDDNFNQVVRLYQCNGCPSEDFIEFYSTIGPMQLNREAITRIVTDLVSDSTLYTDNNCLVNMKRMNCTSDPESGYYPMTCSSYIFEEESDTRLTVVSSSAHGIASLESGEVEVMLHRRPAGDPDMTAKDTSIVSTTLKVNIGSTDGSTKWRHRAIMETSSRVSILYGDVISDMVKYSEKYNTYYTAMNELPPNIHLLNAERFNDTTMLLRLMHMYETGEDQKYSVPVHLDIGSVFKDYNIVQIEETSLSTLWPVDDMNRLNWNTEREENLNANANPSVITFYPLDIHTFLCQIEEP